MAENMNLVSRLLHGMDEDVVTLLEPCLKEIDNRDGLLSIDEDKIMKVVLEVFEVKTPADIRTLVSLKERVTLFKRLPVKSIQQNVALCILIDDSNLWIEAKKLYARKCGLLVDEDPRIRIEIGTLLDVVSKGRPICRCNIYGSEPPARDTFWKKFADTANPNVGIANVFTFGRSKSGEKQVDTKLAVDAVTYARELSSDVFKCILVLNTGDLDILPAIETVINKTETTVELWSWKSCLSMNLKKYAANNPDRFCINLLEEKEDITYKILEVQPKYSSRQDLTYVLVTNEYSDIYKINDVVEAVCRWPAVYNRIDDTTVQVYFRPVDRVSFQPKDFQSKLMSQSDVPISSILTHSEYLMQPANSWDY